MVKKKIGLFTAILIILLGLFLVVGSNAVKEQADNSGNQVYVIQDNH